MYIVINLTDPTIEAVAKDHYTAAEWAADKWPEDDHPEQAYLVAPLEGKTFSRFTKTELLIMYRNAFGEKGASLEFATLLSRLLDHAQEMKPVRSKPMPPAPSDKPATKKSGGGSATPARPKAGTSTGRVWDIADALYQEQGAEDIKALRASIIAKCEAEGINKATAQVQYGKWKRVTLSA